MPFFNWLRSSDQRILDLEAQLEAERRKLAIAEAEVESMAAVIARDRARVQSETAAYNRRRAIAEGTQDEQQLNASIRRFAEIPD